ncbi:hypothetical protein CsSME_00022650 [Camellia sinensis var. sinensis]
MQKRNFLHAQPLGNRIKLQRNPFKKRKNRINILTKPSLNLIKWGRQNQYPNGTKTLCFLIKSLTFGFIPLVPSRLRFNSSSLIPLNSSLLNRTFIQRVMTKGLLKKGGMEINRLMANTLTVWPLGTAECFAHAILRRGSS